MKIEEYFKELQSRHNYCLDFNDFSSTLALYPATLVAMADGEFSALERGNIISALKEATDNDIVLFEMYRLLNNLIELDANEKASLLQSIKEAIADKPDLKAIVLELMVSTADADDGISNEEAALIDELKTTLSI